MKQSRKLSTRGGHDRIPTARGALKNYVESNEIHLIVRDSEIGFDPAEAMEESGVGLTVMRERLNMLGGKLWIESQGRRGTTIHASVPINKN
jgi:signal transduction histidine kinase